VGNLLNIYDYKMGSPQVQTFTYDGADRLTSASASGGTQGNVALESYSYQPGTGVLSSKGGQALSYTANNNSIPGGLTIDSPETFGNDNVGRN
jgi:YD repeat-containing protein